jgi:pimeloyl-[acyl-carrier protein] synthase
VGRLAHKARTGPRRFAAIALRQPLVHRAVRRIAPLAFDPFDPAFRVDPYPTYRRLRETEPVHWSVGGFWVLTRYADVVSVLHDPRFVHPEYGVPRGRRGAPTSLDVLRANGLAMMNPPDHARLRRVVGQVFTPRLVSALRSRAEFHTERLLERVRGRRQMDVIADLALPLPVALVGELMGLPPEDAERCQAWTQQCVRAFGLGPTRAALKRADEGAARFFSYFRDVARARRECPGPDLVSGLVRAHDAGDLAEAEMLATCTLLFFAAYDTTAGLVGNAALTLLRHDLYLLLRENPGLMRTAIEELLRFESPGQLFGRMAAEDVVLDGRRIRRGQTVFAALGAANRDPAQFAAPDRVDLSRQENRHVAFGYGIHACVGQGLARLEAQVALEALTRRMPDLRLVPAPSDWRPDIGFRGLRSLSVTW